MSDVADAALRIANENRNRLKALEEKLDLLDQLVGEGDEKLNKRVERIETKCRYGFSGHTQKTNLLAARVANLERFPVIEPDPEPEQDEERDVIEWDGKQPLLDQVVDHYQATIKTLEEELHETTESMEEMARGNTVFQGKFFEAQTDLTEATAMLKKAEFQANRFGLIVLEREIHKFLRRMEGGDEDGGPELRGPDVAEPWSEVEYGVDETGMKFPLPPTPGPSVETGATNSPVRAHGSFTHPPPSVSEGDVVAEIRERRKNASGDVAILLSEIERLREENTLLRQIAVDYAKDQPLGTEALKDS